MNLNEMERLLEVLNDKLNMVLELNEQLTEQLYDVEDRAKMGKIRVKLGRISHQIRGAITARDLVDANIRRIKRSA